MFAAEARGDVAKGTAKRWAAHTPNMKKLPERKTDDAEKKAFVSEFVLACARRGITAPADVAAAAEKFAAELEKRAGAGDAAGGVLGAGLGAIGTTAALGSVVLPLTVGFGAGNVLSKMRNQADTDDADVMRLHAEANAYRRRLAENKTQGQVRKLLASDPKRYVLIG